MFAFTKLNIEAYPNPAPVILEITAQAPGLSAEEMERYYTIPMEVGLAIDARRRHHPLDLVLRPVLRARDFQLRRRLLFRAYRRRRSTCSRTSVCRTIVSPQIQASSLVGEIYRYQVTGPPHFGLTNLRTVQDWVVQRRLLTVPGVVQVNTWGGTTKEYEVEVDLHKLDAYNVTLPQVISRASATPISMSAAARSISASSRSISAASA